MRNKILVGIGCLVLAIGSTQADEQIPAAVKAKMNGYIGTWEFSEEVLETPSSDPITVNGEWTARWIFDNLIEWSGTFLWKGSEATLVQYEGYDKQHKGFSYWFISSGLRGDMYDGVWDGNTMSWQHKDFAPDGSATRGRCKFSYKDDFTKIDYVCEGLTDGVWWVSRRGNAKKK